MPRVALMPSALPIFGRRRSASIRITRLPASASEAARFSAVVVLPSEGEAPVIITERVRHVVLATRRGERGAQRPVGLDAGGRELVRSDRALGARAALLRDAGQDRQPVEGAQLVLAAKARVEDLGREGAADAEREAGDDARDDAEVASSARPARWACRRACRADRRVVAGAQRLERAELGPERVRGRRRRARGRASTRGPQRLDRGSSTCSWSFSVRSSTTDSAERRSRGSGPTSAVDPWP